MSEGESIPFTDLGNDEIAGFALSPDDNTFAFIRGRWIHDAVLIEGLK